MMLAALVRKEFIELQRDPVTIAVSIVLPLILLFLFGYGVTMDVEDVRLAVYDGSKTQESRRFIQSFSASGYFRVVERLDSVADVRDVLDHGRASAVIVIPEDFARQLGAGRPTTVQVAIDGSFSATALIVSNYISAVINRHSMELAAQRAASYGVVLPAEIQIATRVWYNAPMRSVNYIVPGLFAVLLMAFPPMLTALSIVREKERGTIEQIYVSPVSPAIFLLSKILPYGLVAFVEMLLILVAGTLWFDIPFRGSLPLLLATSLLYVLVTVGIGVLVSISARTQVAAVLLSLVLTLMPAFLFSGFLFPIATMPYVLQLYTYFFPARYFNDISRDLFLKGVGLEYIWLNTLLLLVYASILFGLASARFSKKVTA
jgi:ABC-2 type transport system permease protein